MVYCIKCGTKNPDDAKSCAKCGAQFYATGENTHRRMENECFGIPRGGAVVGLAFGVIILLWGLIWFLQQLKLISEDISVWPFAVILFGTLIMIGAFFGLRRRH